jgi:hypothetical protein
LFVSCPSKPLVNIKQEIYACFFFFSLPRPSSVQNVKGESEEQNRGTSKRKKKLSRSTAVSVQTAQAERGAKKVQMNNKNKTSNKQK